MQCKVSIVCRREKIQFISMITGMFSTVLTYFGDLFFQIRARSAKHSFIGKLCCLFFHMSRRYQHASDECVVSSEFVKETTKKIKTHHIEKLYHKLLCESFMSIQ